MSMTTPEDLRASDSMRDACQCWPLVSQLGRLVKREQVISILYQRKYDTDHEADTHPDRSSSLMASRYLAALVVDSGVVPSLWWLPRNAIEDCLCELDTLRILRGDVKDFTALALRRAALASMIRLIDVLIWSGEYEGWRALLPVIVQSLAFDQSVSRSEIRGFLVQLRERCQSFHYKTELELQVRLALLFVLHLESGEVCDATQLVSNRGGRSDLISDNSGVAAQWIQATPNDGDWEERLAAGRWETVKPWLVLLEGISRNIDHARATIAALMSGTHETDRH